MPNHPPTHHLGGSFDGEHKSGLEPQSSLPRGSSVKYGHLPYNPTSRPQTPTGASSRGGSHDRSIDSDGPQRRPSISRSATNRPVLHQHTGQGEHLVHAASSVGSHRSTGSYAQQPVLRSQSSRQPPTAQMRSASPSAQSVGSEPDAAPPSPRNGNQRSSSVERRRPSIVIDPSHNSRQDTLGDSHTQAATHTTTATATSGVLSGTQQSATYSTSRTSTSSRGASRTDSSATTSHHLEPHAVKERLDEGWKKVARCIVACHEALEEVHSLTLLASNGRESSEGVTRRPVVAATCITSAALRRHREFEVNIAREFNRAQEKYLRTRGAPTRDISMHSDSDGREALNILLRDTAALYGVALTELFGNTAAVLQAAPVPTSSGSRGGNQAPFAPIPMTKAGGNSDPATTAKAFHAAATPPPAHHAPSQPPLTPVRGSTPTRRSNNTNPTPLPLPHHRDQHYSHSRLSKSGDYMDGGSQEQLVLG